MHELLRLFLMLGVTALAAMLVGSVIAWWTEEPRRMARLAKRVLGGAPDGLIVAQGRGAAAAFRLEADRVLVMRDGGAFALLYPLAKLQGAELLVDEQVVARVAEGEPRRLLDRIPPSAFTVHLRLTFDDARYPDFGLDLWLLEDARRRQSRPAPIVIQEARGWLTRADAILRRKAHATAQVEVSARNAPVARDSDARGAEGGVEAEAPAAPPPPEDLDPPVTTEPTGQFRLF